MTSADSRAKSRLARQVHRYPHPTPHNAAAWLSSLYVSEMVEFGIMVMVLGVLLIICCVPLYQCLVGIRHHGVCQFKWIDAQRGKWHRWAVAMALCLVMSWAALSTTIAARGEIVNALDDASTHLSWLSTEFGTLANTAREARARATSLSCDENVTSSLVQALDATLGELATDLTHAAHPLRRARRKIERLVRVWPRFVLPFVGFVPTAIVALLYCCGIAPHGDKHGWAMLLDSASCASFCLSLPSALMAFTIFFVGNIITADFCVLGPADVIETQSNKNAILAFYVRGCRQGTSPLSQSAANATAVAQLLHNETDCDDAKALEADLVSLESTLSECDPIRGVAQTLYYSTVCDDIVVNFFIASVALAVAGFSNLALSLCVPPAKVAFDELLPVHDAAGDKAHLNAESLLGQGRAATGSSRRDVGDTAVGLVTDDHSRDKQRRLKRKVRRVRKKLQIITKHSARVSPESETAVAQEPPRLEATPSLQRLLEAAREPSRMSIRTRKKYKPMALGPDNSRSLFRGALVPQLQEHPRVDKLELGELSRASSQPLSTSVARSSKGVTKKLQPASGRDRGTTPMPRWSTLPSRLSTVPVHMPL